MKTQESFLTPQVTKKSGDTGFKRDLSKKGNLLPPIGNSPKSTRKGQSPVHKHEQKKQSSLIVVNSSSILRKQRKFVPDEYDQKAIVLCQFCGGQTCPQEDYKTNKIQPNAIHGLHSNWITQNILATQRPSNRLIKQHNLLQVFEKYNINSILNLQEPGEHPYCGDGIDPMVGFSYDPQLFFNHRKPIRFENEFWEDMTSTTFQQMMKIMNIFQRSIVHKKGKIAVHCHAGRGRTLMAICSWLIYHDRMTAQQTIELAVLKRQGVLTRTSQRDFLRDFQKQLYKRWRSYSLKIQAQRIRTFSQFVEWQNLSLLKSQKKVLNQTPYLHGTIMAILRKRMKTECKQILYSFIDINEKTIFGQKWDNQHEHRLSFLKTYIDLKKIDHLQQNEDVRIFVALLEDFYDALPFTPISLHAIDQLKAQLETQRQIQKNNQTKRSVKKQDLKGKVLKRWDDIIKERQSAIQSPDKQKKDRKQSPQNHQQKPNSSSDIPIESRVKEIQQVSKQTIPQISISAPPQQQQNTSPESSQYNNFKNNQNTSELFFENKSKLLSQLPKSQFGSQSQLQVNTLYLNVLTEPSIIHEVGLSSLCTFIDFVRFAMELMKCYKSCYEKQTEEHYKLMERGILAKFSILLQSKKRYFPVLFRGQNFRDSVLLKKIDKLEKYSNQNIKYMSQSFMKQFITELQQIFKEQNQVINEETFQKLIFKIQKVNANVDHFSKSHSNSGGKWFSASDAKKVYDDARL